MQINVVLIIIFTAYSTKNYHNQISQTLPSTNKFYIKTSIPQLHIIHYLQFAINQ